MGGCVSDKNAIFGFKHDVMNDNWASTALNWSYSIEYVSELSDKFNMRMMGRSLLISSDRFIELVNQS